MMERTVLLLPFILSNLVTPSLSLSCTECYGPGAKLCQGVSVICPTDTDSCVLTVESETQDGKEITLSRQYCGKRSMCLYSGILATSYSVRRISSSCCFTSNCSPSVPKLPTEKTDKNGVRCKSCDVDKGKPCDFESPTIDTVECTGDEKMCVFMSNSTTAGQLRFGNSASGCGSEGLCKTDKPVIKVGGAMSEITYTCTSGAAAFPPVLPAMLLAALYIMKAIS
ncbi:phospholipase A2 inhibitor and Ly6/PLAUR domain-containing protein-like [Leptodactylus fuscus]|uniref:phospholipase A2 inhibitor and Ly6/PLAUR domain-containing protein-like n=1 Tax=Leptodactylus fuscus TaxID=238119 RepID=UPI003F4EC6D9